MAATYKATGINLKAMPLGESDRLLTVLTREYGLMRVVASGCRKHNSKLGGRSALFVVNDLLILKGRSLDKLIQAETSESYPGLGRDLRKLTVAQYLAELVLLQALSDQPQDELFSLLNEHLARIEDLPGSLAIACLTHATFHLLSLAGISPSVQTCCLTQQPLLPDFSEPDWRVGFSLSAGGTVDLAALEQLPDRKPVLLSADSSANSRSRFVSSHRLIKRGMPLAAEQPSTYSPSASGSFKRADLQTPLSAIELAIFQRLAQPELIRTDGTLFQSDEDMPRSQVGDLDPPGQPLHQPIAPQVWLSIERILRHYAQYHFDRPIRSAALIDTCFALPS